MKYRKHPSVEAVFSIIRLVVVGLIASASLLLMNTANFGSPTDNPLQFAISIALFLFAYVGLKRWKLSPILLILLCGSISGVLYSFL